MAEFTTLHIKLSEILGDPRSPDGSLISSISQDGIRYSAIYRSRLINSGIRWVITTFDPMYLQGNGIPLSDDTGGTEIFVTAELDDDSVNTFGYTRFKSKSGSLDMTRLLAVHDITLDKNIPIISLNFRRLRFMNNSHWTNVEMAFPVNRNIIGIIHPLTATSTYHASYIKDFADISTDINIGLPQHLHDYVIMYAVYLNKINSQRFQEGAILRQMVDQETQLVKSAVEQTKQLAYNK